MASALSAGAQAAIRYSIAILGRGPTAAELDSWTAAYKGSSATASADAVATAIVASAVGVAALRPGVFTEMKQAQVILGNHGVTDAAVVAYVEGMLVGTNADAGKVKVPLSTVARIVADFFSNWSSTPSNPYNDVFMAGKSALTSAAAIEEAKITGVVPPVSADGADIKILATKAAGADVMRLTGSADVRIDMTNTANQIKGLDLNNDGKIATDGVENDIKGKAANYEIVDAYPRAPLNTGDKTNNYNGDIAYDGTGYYGDGVNTDGNIFLGGLGNDTALGGIGNDFLAGGYGADVLAGGRNADFFFVELSLLDRTDGNKITIDGGFTVDSQALGNNTPQDSDWLLLEASDDDEPVKIYLGTVVPEDGQTVATRAGATVASMREIEHLDASGNLYGFLNDINVKLGGNGTKTASGENVGIGSSAQLDIIGSDANNILIGGYDNDSIFGGLGNDLIMGGNLNYHQNNPNLPPLVGLDNGRDDLSGGAGDDNIVFESDGGTIDGGTHSKGDTLWITKDALGLNKAADMLTDGVIRIDLNADLLAVAAGYGGADASDSRVGGTGTQDQTNYKLSGKRVDMTGMESVIATGMGAIDYKAAGANTPELTFTNQQNHFAYVGNLDLRGTDAGLTQTSTKFDVTATIAGQSVAFSSTYSGVLTLAQASARWTSENPTVTAASTGLSLMSVSPVNSVVGGDNTLYASSGNDVLEGRTGPDLLSGGAGNDDFLFESSNDGLDTIHRQKDIGNNLTDGSFVQDFGALAAVSDGKTYLTAKIITPLGTATDNVGITQFEVTIDGKVFGKNLTAAQLVAITDTTTLASTLNASYNAQDPQVSVVRVDASTVQVVVDRTATIATTVATGTTIAGTAVNAPFQVDIVPGQTAGKLAGDRLIYVGYEDRADNERVDDDAVIDAVGDAISLGTNYAEDLVASFSAAGSTLTQNQKYRITFTNLAEEDVVTITVNGVDYTAQVGVNVNGSDNASDYNNTTRDFSPFLDRLAALISASDRDTSAGSIIATRVTGSTTTIEIDQADGLTGEDVFMAKPVVAIQDKSRGETATASVVETSAHSVFLLGFDGRDGGLSGVATDTLVNSTGNILFVGDSGENRAVFATAKNTGSTLTGEDAIAYDTIRDADLVAIDGAVHGHDELFTGAGNDVVNAGTGDDRVYASRGVDVVDGGKNLYFVSGLGTVAVPQNTVVIRNDFENTAAVTAEAGTLLPGVGSSNADQNGEFKDTLVVQRSDYAATSTFTLSLDANHLLPDTAATRAGGIKGTVTEDGTTNVTTFTNFESVRIVGGGSTVASQSSDTFDLRSLAVADDDATIAYNLSTGGLVVSGANNAARYTTITITGFENVTTGSTQDQVTIQESEIALNNRVDLGTSLPAGTLDRVIYDFSAASANTQHFGHSVRVIVEAAANTDYVDFTSPSISGNPRDVLVGVEALTFQGDAANQAGVKDVLDNSNVTGSITNFGGAITIGASLGGGTLDANSVSASAAAGTELITITGIDRLETVIGSALPDRVVLEVRTPGAPQQTLRTFQLGAGEDWADYRNQNASDLVVIVDGSKAGTDFVYVVTDYNALSTGGFRDSAADVENYIAGVGNDDSVIDVSSTSAAATIEFFKQSQVLDPNGVAVTGGIVATGTYFRTEVRDASGVLANFYGLGSAPANDWNVVKGGAFGETVIFNDTSAAQGHVLTLAGGANIVNAAAITTTAGTDVVLGSFSSVSSSHNLIANTGTQTITVTGTNNLTVVGSGDTLNGLGDLVDASALSSSSTKGATVNLTTGVAQEITHTLLAQATGANYSPATRTVVNTVNLQGFEEASGGVGPDLLIGSATSNVLTGGGGNDTLSGGAGGDTLVLGDGIDFARGGTGSDIINLTETVSSVDYVIIGLGDTSSTGSDTLSNFTPNTDKIMLEASDSTGGWSAGNSAFTLGAGSAQIAIDLGSDNVLLGSAADTTEYLVTTAVTTTLGDYIWRVLQSGGADAQVLPSTRSYAVHFVYSSQGQSVLGTRDSISGIDKTRNDVIDFRGFLSNDIDMSTGTSAAETLELRNVVSVDAASTITGMFAASTDVNGSNAGNGNVLMVLQREGTTSDYRLFVDVNKDGNFDQATDMVIDLVNVIGVTVGGAGYSQAEWQAIILAGAQPFGG